MQSTKSHSQNYIIITIIYYYIIAPACQAEGTLENTRLMADLARRAALLWLDLRSDSSRTAPSAEERSRLERYNAEHLGFVRKDPDNSVRRARSGVRCLRILTA